MNCFIPFVGWIVGAILDLRDLIANTVKDDWVAAGMSVVGVVPYTEDTANMIALTMDDLSAIDKLRRAHAERVSANLNRAELLDLL